MRTIAIGRHGQYQVVVDECDYEFLTQWLWTFKISRGGKVYARRHRRVGGQRETVLMHNEVMERKGEPRPTAEHTPDHGNRDSLDNRRDNLNWASRSEQNRNRVFSRRKSLLIVCDEADSLPF